MTLERDRALLAELEALEKEETKRSRHSEWCPEFPTPKQKQFLESTALEAMYGGGVGGGKSSAILAAALAYVDTPGYAALLLRRTYRDLALPGALMDRASLWLTGTKAKFSGVDKTWKFPSGATLTFGFCESSGDVHRYAGSQFHFIGIDEAGQWGEAEYRFLLSRLRRPAGFTVPLRARLTANPGGRGHFWLKSRFVDSKDPSRIFIPSLLKDNPYLDREEYEKALALLDEQTKRQLLEGIWEQSDSNLVYRPPTIIDQAPASGKWTYLLGLDFGVRDATAWTVLGYREGERRNYVIESGKQTGFDVTAAADKYFELDKRFKFVKVVGDEGGLGKGFAEEMRNRRSIPIEPAEKRNKLGYLKLINGALERKELVIVGPANKELLAEMQVLPWADELHDRPAEGFEDHCLDSMLYVWRASTAYSQALPATPPQDPLDIIRQQTAAVWARHEEQSQRQHNEDRWSTYNTDIGEKFTPGDEW